jgi:hypothetical protein
MKSKHFLLNGIIAFVIIAITFSSCRRTRITDDDLESANDHALAEGSSNEMQNISDQAYSLGNNNGFRNSSAEQFLGGPCATVTYDSINAADADTMLVDFGTSPCQGWDGRFRQGQMIIIYTDRYKNDGAVIDISFNGYKVGKTATEMNLITGTKHIINNGLNAASNMNWTITANLTITKSTGKIITFTESKTREWIAGSTTPTYVDDKFKIGGTALGNSSNGKNFSAQVVVGHELIRDMTCPKHFTEGIVEITPDSRPMVSIDFGSGACDNTAVLTRNNKTKTITLK